MDALGILVRLAWLVGASMFVIGLMRMNSPATARNGNLISAAGMAIAIGATAVLLLSGGAGGTAWLIIVIGIAIGGGLGLYTARTVAMTAMPQLVSLFNAVGGGAAALIAIEDYFTLAGSPENAELSTTVFIVLVGAMIIAATAHDAIGYLLALVAVAFATMNVVGGYVVTDRMLQMFRKRGAPRAPSPDEIAKQAEG